MTLAFLLRVKEAHTKEVKRLTSLGMYDSEPEFLTDKVPVPFYHTFLTPSSNNRLHRMAFQGIKQSLHVSLFSPKFSKQFLKSFKDGPTIV